MTKRSITKDELEIMTLLLARAGQNHNIPSDVIEMDDGGMGSLMFHEKANRRFGRQISEAYYLDIDDVPVILSVYVDDQNNLFELDVWKVDYSTLKKFPKATDLRFDKIPHTDRAK